MSPQIHVDATMHMCQTLVVGAMRAAGTHALAIIVRMLEHNVSAIVTFVPTFIPTQPSTPTQASAILLVQRL